MKPNKLKTLIYLDGGDPDETMKIRDKMGFLDGQTTNPTFVSKNPEVKKRLERGEKFSQEDLLDFYHHDVINRIAEIIPNGSISIEVYADHQTTTDQMLEQAQRMFTWTPNAHIKFPSTKEGIKAAWRALKEGVRVNMTLCFQQQQAAAVYAATKGADRGSVYISPFVGRLYDCGERGMDLIANIGRMYQKGDGHVMQLAASLRNLDMLKETIALQADIATAKLETLTEWADTGLQLPPAGFKTPSRDDEAPIPYQELDLEADWQSFDLSHPKTDEGLTKFSDDWNKLLAQ
ncbi:MAG: hypothetical protein K9L19_18175 [Desulfarculaceae bacterium]|nr:hypothetical protein [Desulfarculaceae bacterium]MCF8049481.1 hypothetical protein [Desulfarculaceae bacterium]